MNILITGGAGFIGTNLAESLTNLGNKVTVVDNFLTGSMHNVDYLSSYKNYKFVEMGIESSKFLKKFTSKKTHHFDQVFHLACPTGVPNIKDLGEEMVDACSFGTKNVLRVALHHNARLLFTSSSEVYGDPLIPIQPETYTGNVDPQGFRANYEEGKRFSETLVSLFINKYNLDAFTVRFFNVYGPKMSLSDYRVIPRFVTQALSGSALTVQGDGSQKRTLCYISDVVAGLILVMQKANKGDIYNIGSDQGLTMKELAEAIIKLTNSTSEIASIERPSHDPFSRMPDLSRMYNLGWKQKVELSDGLKNTIEDFKNRLNPSPLPQESASAALA